MQAQRGEQGEQAARNPLCSPPAHPVSRSAPEASGSVMEEVQGGAGSAEAALKAVKAPQLAGRGNWLSALGAEVKQRQGRRLVGRGRDAALPQGVAASRTSGKLSFSVMYKYHEVRSPHMTVSLVDKFASPPLWCALVA
jgi:hypothetical protein